MRTITLRGLTAAGVLTTALLAFRHGAARASDTTLEFTVPVNGVNACTGEGVTGQLRALLVVSGNGQTHVSVRGLIRGELAGNRGTTYHLSGGGGDQYGVVADHYDFGFHANAITEGSTPNFSLDGVARVLVNASNEPVGTTIVSSTANCP